MWWVLQLNLVIDRFKSYSACVLLKSCPSALQLGTPRQRFHNDEVAHCMCVCVCVCGHVTWYL